MKTNILTLAITLAIAIAFLGSCQKNQNASDFEYVANSDGTIVINGYKGTAKDVKIPQKINGKKVVAIDSYTFAEKDLTSVIIPNTVVYIGAEAFIVNKLTTVAIPNSVTVIREMAFMFNNLTSVTIPKSVVDLAEDAFDESVEIIRK